MTDNAEGSADVNDENYPPLDSSREIQDAIGTESPQAAENHTHHPQIKKSMKSPVIESVGVQGLEPKNDPKGKAPLEPHRDVSTARDSTVENGEFDLTPMDVGYTLMVKYNGIFDPFRDDAALFALLNRAGPGVQTNVEGQKSRFEQLFK
jgi:hypothetical protein